MIAYQVSVRCLRNNYFSSYTDTFHMVICFWCIVDVLAHFQRHEAQMWTLIDDQHVLRTLIEQTPASECIAVEINRLLNQYETQACQMVTVQLHLRLKLMECSRPEMDTVTTAAKDVLTSDTRLGHSYLCDPSKEAIVSPDNFACTQCPRTFLSQKGLFGHMSAHPKTKKAFACPDCPKSFHTEAHYKRHQQNHRHNTYFMCQLCDESFASAGALNSHRRKHISAGEQYDEHVYACRLCQLELKAKVHLQRHFRECHAGAKPFYCDVCARDFALSNQLKYHNIVHHGAAGAFECHICRGRFGVRWELVRHLESHDNVTVTCDQCGKSLRNKFMLRNHVKLQHPKKSSNVLCAQCGKAFRYPSVLEQHMLEHTGERPFACTKCDARYRFAVNLRRHMNNVHSDVPAFECWQCRRPFFDPNCLRRHMRTVHTAERRYACTVCDKRFSTSTGLQVHAYRHTGTKRFVCTVCDKRFYARAGLVEHERGTHTGERPYACDRCDLRFTSKRYMKKHQKTHEK